MIQERNKLINIWFFIAFLYPLAISRTRQQFMAPVVDGITGSNIVYVAGVCFILALLSVVFARYGKLVIHLPSITSFYIIFSIYVLLSNYLFRNNADGQRMYAILMIILPMSLAVFGQTQTKGGIQTPAYLISCASILYSCLGIYRSLSGGQHRTGMSLGVSTTVVLFYIMVLPIIRFSIVKSKKGLAKTLLYIGYLMVIVASLLTLSRAGFAVVAFMVAWSIFDSSAKGKKQKRMFKIIACVSALLFLSSYLDLSRLFMGFSDDSSTGRTNAALVGWEIFKNNPIFGAGCGTYYKRLYTYDNWTEKLISVNGVTGHLDPHNAYILLLSETGIIGFAIFVCAMVYIWKCISKIQNESIKIAGKQFMAGVLMYSFTSSDIFAKPGVSVIFWLLIGLLISFYNYESRNKDAVSFI